MLWLPKSGAGVSAVVSRDGKIVVRKPSSDPDAEGGVEFQKIGNEEDDVPESMTTDRMALQQQSLRDRIRLRAAATRGRIFGKRRR